MCPRCPDRADRDLGFGVEWLSGGLWFVVFDSSVKLYILNTLAG